VRGTVVSRWIGIAVIVVAAAAVLVYKSVSRPDPTPGPPAPAGRAPRVLLFADLREAGDQCACGEMIRAVRETAARGVSTRENDDGLGRAHHVTVEPTVVILDPDGHEQARFEGEAGATVDSLRAALGRLTP